MISRTESERNASPLANPSNVPTPVTTRHSFDPFYAESEVSDETLAAA